MYPYNAEDKRIYHDEKFKSVDILKQCRNECFASDCTRLVFDAMMLHGVIDSNITGYYVVPKMMAISNVFYDKFMLIEYVIVSAGIINIWFGISLLKNVFRSCTVTKVKQVSLEVSSVMAVPMTVLH